MSKANVHYTTDKAAQIRPGVIQATKWTFIIIKWRTNTNLTLTLCLKHGSGRVYWHNNMKYIMNKVTEVFQKKQVCNNTTLKGIQFYSKRQYGNNYCTKLPHNHIKTSKRPNICMKNFPHYVFHFVNRNSLIWMCRIHKCFALMEI